MESVLPPEEIPRNTVKAGDIHVRVPTDLYDRIKAEAEGLNVPMTEYVRELLLREFAYDPEERFTRQLADWWKWRGQGDPQVIVGAIGRARAAGMTFSRKFRMMMTVMLQQQMI